jgi:hypothetical protein
MLIITPKTKVGELLESFPALESVLINMSPAFEKLKNPILRKTVAKVATIQQIAVVGGLNADEIVRRLRKEIGQSEGPGGESDTQYQSDTVPKWFDEGKIIKSFDASPVINSGGSPMNDILTQAKELKTGEIFELVTPFVPAPIIDMLKSKGFMVYTRPESQSVRSYITR